MACRVTQVGCSTCSGSQVASSPQISAVIDPAIFFESYPSYSWIGGDEEDYELNFIRRKPKRFMPHPLSLPNYKELIRLRG